MGSPNPYQALVSNPDIALEFKSKVEELSRRLNANGFNYQNDYSVMNDRQRDIFTTGLFVMPEQADSIEEYVEFGHDNCECPDVMEDLDQTCPMLMKGVNTINERERVQESSTIETTLDLLIEQLINEVMLQEARGVQHPDTFGLRVSNAAGTTVETVGRRFAKIGEPEAVKTQEQLALAVYANIAQVNGIPLPKNLKAALANKKLNQLILWSGAKSGAELDVSNLPTSIKSAQIILAKQVDKKDALSKETYAFVRYSSVTSIDAQWPQKNFGQLTGFGSKTTQSGKEIQTIGPPLLGDGRANKMALSSVPGSLDAALLETLDGAFARSLPAYLKAAVEGKALPVLQFESEENRDQYLPSVRKYLSEITGPIFLATGNKTYLGNDAVLDSAFENLLQPRGIGNWTENDGVSWPTSANEKLKDSYVHFGDKQDIMVSSKAGKGANPSLKELYAELKDIGEEEKQQLIRLYGVGNPSGVNLYSGNEQDPGIVEILSDASYVAWQLPARMIVEIPASAYQEAGFQKLAPLTADEYNELNEILKGMRVKGGFEREFPPFANKALAAKCKAYRDMFAPDTSKSAYSEAFHTLAGMAKVAQRIINTIEDENGEKLFTNFAKAMYNRLPLVQIYAKGPAYVADGKTGIKSGPMDIIYPARFDGVINIDGGKNYYATKINGRMTIAIK